MKLAVVVTLIVACGCQTAPDPAGTTSPRPAELQAFLTWAAERLQEEPEPVPPPGPEALESLPRRWESIHLLDHVNDAETDSTWAPREDGPLALAVVTNVSSQRPDDHVMQRIDRNATLEVRTPRFSSSVASTSKEIGSER